jgi:hypothetical protein
MYHTKEGPDEPIRLISGSTWAADINHEFDDGTRFGQGFSIMFETLNHTRHNWIIKGYWPSTKRPRFRKEIIEVRRMLLVEFQFWNRCGSICIRLWRLPIVAR